MAIGKSVGRRSRFSTVADRYVERSGHNHSVEESFNLSIPGPRLIQGLDLRLAEGRLLSYRDSIGDILFKDHSAETPGHSALSAFLDREDLELIWIILREKSAQGGRPHRSGWGRHLEYWGIYRFDGNAITDRLQFAQKRLNREHLAEFFARR